VTSFGKLRAGSLISVFTTAAGGGCAALSRRPSILKTGTSPRAVRIIAARIARPAP
jgi:hypothetical protein